MQTFNASIPLQGKSIQPGEIFNSIAQIQNIRSQAANLNAMRKKAADAETLNNAMRDSVDPVTGEIDNIKLNRSLATAGLGSSIPSVTESLAKSKEATSKAASSDYEYKQKLVNGLLGTVSNASSKDDVHKYLEQVRVEHKLPDSVITKLAGSLEGVDSPEAFTKWKSDRLFEGMQLKDQWAAKKPVMVNQDTGSGGRTVAIDPTTNQANTVQGSEFTKGISAADQAKIDIQRDNTNSLKQYRTDKLAQGDKGKTTGLLDEEQAALNRAVTEARLDPRMINRTTAKIFARMAIDNPHIDFNTLAGQGALTRNPQFQDRIITAQILPEMLTNLDKTASKMNFSDNKYQAELEKWYKGASNDPDFRAYMTQRADTIMAITRVMRGVGMSEGSINIELNAAPDTMSPAAFKAWSKAQMKALEPRLQSLQQLSVTSGKPRVPGADVPGKTSSSDNGDGDWQDYHP